MRRRLVIALSIACVIAAAGIVLMCLNNGTDVRTADKKAAVSFDALKIDNEPEFKEYSNISDPYQRAEKIKEDNKDVNSDGYVISLKDSAGDDVIAAIDEAISNGAQIKALEYTDRTYTCSSLDEFSAIVDGSYVETAEPDFEVRMLGGDGWLPDPNDEQYNKQYNIEKLNALSAWEYSLEGQDTDLDVDADGDGNKDDAIIIAVIDSGLYEDHEDIDKTRIETGRGFIEDTSYTGDTNGHGTSVSGIIAATKNNRKCISGLLQGVKIMPLRVFDESGEGSMSVVISAINYAVRQKNDEGRNVAVINMSLGGTGGSSALKKACNDAINSGIIVVCAAGNEYNTKGHLPCYPAQYTMGVGSLNSNLKVSSFSQRWDKAIDGEGAERKVWVTAPGEGIYSPSHSSQTGYRIGSGTSFACPEVAALAAICKSINNDIDQTTFMQLLKETVIPSMSEGEQIQDTAYGWGKVDFKSTIDKMIDDTDPQSSVTVKAFNVLGSEISDPDIKVRTSTGSEVHPAGGVWTLDKKTRYTITTSQTGYEEKTIKITPALDNIEKSFTLEGTTEYPVRLSVRDSDGADLLEDAYAIAVERESGAEEIKANGEGNYPLNVGRYCLRIKSGKYYLGSEIEFDINDMTENLSYGKTIDVVLRRDAVWTNWIVHRGTTSSEEKPEPLKEIKDSGNCKDFTVADGNEQSYDVHGIRLADLLDLAMPLEGEKVSVSIEGKKIKHEGDVNNDDLNVASDTPDYELVDDSLTLKASEIGDAIIVMDSDPEGHYDIMNKYNSMRLVIDGRDTEDWLYAPSLITLEIAASIEDCDVSGISDRMYTGKSITQDPVVEYDGETLTEGTDYTVEYRNNVNPGRASVIITGAGGFTGKKTVSFTITEPPHKHSYADFVAKEPTEDAEGSMGHRCTGCGNTYYTPIARIVYPTDLPSVKISKPKAAKGKITVKWKKVSKKNKKKIGGIEIQVSGPGYYQTFTAGKGKASKKISGLASKQKYNVRIRAYNYIGGVKHVSKWSGWKTSKIK